MAFLRELCVSLVVWLTAVSTLVASWPALSLPCCCSPSSLHSPTCGANCACQTQPDSRSGRSCCQKKAAQSSLNSVKKPTADDSPAGLCCKRSAPEKSGPTYGGQPCQCGTQPCQPVPETASPESRAGSQSEENHPAAAAFLLPALDDAFDDKLCSYRPALTPQNSTSTDLVVFLSRLTC